MPHERLDVGIETARQRWQHWSPQVDGLVRQLEGRLVRVRRHLHSQPEPSGEELETSRFVMRQLSEAGLMPSLGRRGLGVIADLTLGDAAERQPVIAIRADLDALRLPDQKTVPYASKNAGVAHACGHDAHTTIVLGAALAGVGLLERNGQPAPLPPARLRFLFQPAEETSLGAKWLIEQGALEGVAAILGLHVDPEREAGTVGLRVGVLTANCDEIEIVVSGKGGHAARPHHTTDPIAAAVQLIATLYQFLPRAVDSREPSVFSVGQISGGRAANVIPDRVEIHGSLRTTDPIVRTTLKRRLDEICRGVAVSSGADVSVQFLNPLRSVVNDPRVAAALEVAARDVVGEERITRITKPSMGGEDFAVYLDHVPGAMLRLGCATPGQEASFLHSPRFDIDERVLALGSRILLRAALFLSHVTSSESSITS